MSGSDTTEKRREKLVALGTRIPGGMRDDLRAIAESNDRTPSAELRRALRQYIEQHKVEASAS